MKQISFERLGKPYYIPQKPYRIHEKCNESVT